MIDRNLEEVWEIILSNIIANGDTVKDTRNGELWVKVEDIGKEVLLQTGSTKKLISKESFYRHYEKFANY